MLNIKPCFKKASYFSQVQFHKHAPNVKTIGRVTMQETWQLTTNVTPKIDKGN